MNGRNARRARSRASACCRKAENIVWVAGVHPVAAKLYQRALRGVVIKVG